MAECPICYGQVPVSEMLTLSCGHKVEKECLREFFLAVMSNNEVQKVKCPYH